MIRRSVLLTGLMVACGGPGPLPPEAPTPLPSVEAAPVILPNQPDRSQLPSAGPARAWAPPVPASFQLRNGLRVWHLEQGPTPLVTVLLVVQRGSATDPIGKAGLTDLAVDMLDEGIPGLSALGLSDRLQELATDYGATADVDHVMLSMDLLADTFEKSTQLLADMVRRPTLPREEFVRRKEQRIAQALAAESRPDWARALVVRKVLFGDGYAGEVAHGTRRTLGSIEYRDIKQHLARVLQPDVVELVVVGGIDRAAAEHALDRAFGDWQGKAKAEPAKLTDGASGPMVALVDFPGAAQSVLGVVSRAEPIDSPDYFGELVYNREFGGAFSSRLNLNLRENKGYTYGAKSLFRHWRKVGYFGLFADVQSKVTRQSVDEMFSELGAICASRPLSSAQRDEAVSGLLLGFPGRFERVSTIAARFANLPALSRPADWYTRWPDRVSAVTVEEANRVARKYCDPKRFFVVISGDRKTLEPEIASLGLPIVVYDAQGGRVTQVAR